MPSDEMSFIEDLRSISETNEDSIFGLIESKIYTHAKLVAQSVEDNIKQMVRKGDCVIIKMYLDF